MSGTETAGPAKRPGGGLLRHALPWLGIGVSAVFAYLAVRNVDFDDVWAALRSCNYWWLVPSLGALAIAVVLKAIRWRYLFAAETRPGTRPVLHALLVGYFFNSILPARAGEAARVLALGQRGGTSRAESTGTVVIERAYDVLVLLVLLFVALPWLPEVTWLDAAVVLALGLVIVLVAVIVVLTVFGLRPVHWALRPLARLPVLSVERVEEMAANLVHGLAALRRPRLAVGAVLWTTAGWLMLSLSVWFVMRGFDLGLPFAAALLLVIATNVAMILPSSPSAVGVFEAAALVAMRAYGVPDAEALSCALVIHMTQFVPFVATGPFLLPSFLRLRRSLATRADRPVPER